MQTEASTFQPFSRIFRLSNPLSLGMECQTTRWHIFGSSASSAATEAINLTSCNTVILNNHLSSACCSHYVQVL